MRENSSPEAHVSAPTGRISFEGEVIMVRSYENDYGENWKMLMKISTLLGTWLCFVSVPSTLRDQHYSAITDESLAGWLRGKRITLTATLTPGKEKHFTFGKRPTGARIL